MFSYLRSDGTVADPIPFDPFRVVVAATGLVSAVLSATAQAVDHLDDHVRGHANYRSERREFARTVQADIERL